MPSIAHHSRAPQTVEENPSLAVGLVSRLLLLKPSRVRRNLRRAREQGISAAQPNTWQLCLGALRLWHRILFRSDTIGTSSGPPVRSSTRARVLEWRAFRFPFLVAEGAVAPWDLTGLFSSPERLTRHLLAAHHDHKQFSFDLQLLAAHPEFLVELVEKAEQVANGDERRSRWLRDLTVYVDYHQSLAQAAAAAGDFQLTAAKARDPDVSLSGFIQWCADAPTTPAETIRSIRSGSFRFGPEAI